MNEINVWKWPAGRCDIDTDNSHQDAMSTPRDVIATDIQERIGTQKGKCKSTNENSLNEFRPVLEK